MITSHIKVFLQLSQGLVERGYNVTHLLPEDSEEEQYAIKHGIRVFTIPGLNQVLVDSRVELVKRNAYTQSQLFDMLKFSV